ncbi:MAG: ABC transporter permease [Spirochaetia bacterium]
MQKVINNFRVFIESAVLSYRALFRWFKPVTYAASKIIMPLAQMLFFVLLGTFGGAAPASFYIIGNSLQIAAISGIYGVTMSIGGDRWDGTLVYVFGSPANRLVLFFGRSVVHIIDGIIGVCIGFTWGVLLFGISIPFGSAGILFLAVLITVYSTSGLGLLMGCIGLISRNVMFVNNTVYFLLLLFSGANVPLEQLPGWMNVISQCLPLRNGIIAARSIFSGGSTEFALQHILLEFGVGSVYLLLGYFLFRWFEKQAKNSGSLETV